jgi:hypothetical protein
VRRFVGKFLGFEGWGWGSSLRLGVNPPQGGSSEDADLISVNYYYSGSWNPDSWDSGSWDSKSREGRLEVTPHANVVAFLSGRVLGS